MATRLLREPYGDDDRLFQLVVAPILNTDGTVGYVVSGIEDGRAEGR